MDVIDDSANDPKAIDRSVSRRKLLRYTFIGAAVTSILAACQQAAAPAPTAAPAAKPTTAPAAAPTTAPTTAPAAAKPTTAPAAAPTTAATTAPAAAKPTTAPAANANFSGPPAAASFNPSKVNINGKLTVVQARDFHPDHNAYIEAQVKAFAQKMDYALDHSYIEAYAGSGDVVQKLTAAVQ